MIILITKKKPINEVAWTRRGPIIFTTLNSVHAPLFCMGVKHGLSIHQKQSAQKYIWIWKGRGENFWILHKKMCLFLYLWLNSSQCLPLSSHNSGTTGLFRNVHSSSNLSVQNAVSSLAVFVRSHKCIEPWASLIAARIPHLISFIYLLVIRKNVIYKLNWWLYKVRHDTMYFNDVLWYSSSDVTSGALQV